MDDIISSINYFTCRCDFNSRVYFQNPIHCLSDDFNISLYKSTEYDIRCKYFIFFTKTFYSHFYFRNSLKDITDIFICSFIHK